MGRKNDDHVFDKIFGQIIHTAFSRDFAYRVAIIGLVFPKTFLYRWRLDRKNWGVFPKIRRNKRSPKNGRHMLSVFVYIAQ